MKHHFYAALATLVIASGKGNTTQDGKPIKIPVSQGEIDSCRASEAHHHKQETAGHSQGQAHPAPAAK